MGIAGIVLRLTSWRSERKRARELARVRAQLARRGVAVQDLTDAALEAAISDGRKALGTAGVRGGDVTGAFVVVVRSREKF